MSKTPEFAVNARVVLGDIYRAENRIDDAIAEYRAVLAMNKNAGAAWWGLAEIKNRKLSDDDVAQLRAAMNMPGSVDDLSTMGFALARALEDRGQYAESLAALETANARVRAQRGWDAAVVHARTSMKCSKRSRRRPPVRPIHNSDTK